MEHTLWKAPLIDQVVGFYKYLCGKREAEDHLHLKEERFWKLDSECLCFYGICYLAIFIFSLSN